MWFAFTFCARSIVIGGDRGGSERFFLEGNPWACPEKGKERGGVMFIPPYLVSFLTHGMSVSDIERKLS
ncbi:Protein of unknown function [Pyronema omphalodes CBS 100304]|uniref:Uncharacterized protein n=1 Tax=Pyronema omphalodes (strain CBS 100304) TaxID=1076935 RepID=U4LVM2_PYROM|nr:Protein of unknown function [Pyronema omphalodes CBS 100304]